MFRVAVRRSNISKLHLFNIPFLRNRLPNRTLATTFRKANIMEQPVDRQEGELPLCDKDNDKPAPVEEVKALPKLTAQEYRVYNCMADHMNYFVSYQRSPPTEFYVHVAHTSSMTTSDKPGTSYTQPARPENVLRECQSNLSSTWASSYVTI